MMMAGSVADGFSPMKGPKGIMSPKATGDYLSRSAYKGNTATVSIISARNQQTLDSIKDPLLRIKRSVERFGRDMIDIVQKEVMGTQNVKHDINFKKLAMRIASDQVNSKIFVKEDDQ